jgi:hypothetical protein
MNLIRPLVMCKGDVRPAQPGDGLLTAVRIGSNDTDSAQTLNVKDYIGGAFLRGGMTAGRTDTFASTTAADLNAALPNMDIGDSFITIFASSVAYAETLSASGATGITLAGNTAVAANSRLILVITKTGAATFTFTGL